jgi:hypothetical protein
MTSPLTWTPSTGGSGSISRYSVFRSGTLIGTVPGTASTYTDAHGSAATANLRYCRRARAGGSAGAAYLLCTGYDGSGWTTDASPAGVDEGLPTGRAWILFGQHPAYCRRGGSGGSLATQYLLCTTFDGKAWRTYRSAGGIDWGYDTGWSWIATRLGAAYCRRAGNGGSPAARYVACTVFDGSTWRTSTSPAGVDWGQDAGAAWITWGGDPAYCRATGVPPAGSQSLACTTFNGSTRTTASSGGGIDWGYDTARRWLSTKASVAYCRRVGPGGSPSGRYLACTVFNGSSWRTSVSPAGVDWGYDAGAGWVALGGYPSYCRTTGVPPAGSQALACTTVHGSTWTTASSGGGVDRGYVTGRGWVSTGAGAAYCRRAGTRRSPPGRYLICAVLDGNRWQTGTSPGGVYWGYDT